MVIFVLAFFVMAIRLGLVALLVGIFQFFLLLLNLSVVVFPLGVHGVDHFSRSLRTLDP